MTNTGTKGQSIGLQTNSLYLHCICKEILAVFGIVRNYLSEKVSSEKKKQTVEDFTSILTEEFDNVDCDGACAQSSLCQVLITQAKEFIDSGTRLLKYVDTSKINPLFREPNNPTAAESTEEVVEPAKAIDRSAAANHEASLQQGAAARQIEPSTDINQKASIAPTNYAAASRYPPQIALCKVKADEEDIYTSAFNFCSGGNDDNRERNPKTSESDVRNKVKEQHRKSPPPQMFWGPLQSGDLPSNYLPHLKPREDDDLDFDLDHRTNSAPEARSHHHQQFPSLDSSSRRRPQIRQPIKPQFGGQYYHKMKEFSNRNARQNGITSMHESLPEWPTESFSSHQPRQYDSAPAPLNSSERTLASLPVPISNLLSNYDASNDLQADGFTEQDPSSRDAIPSSSSGRLVTDHAPAPALPGRLVTDHAPAPAVPIERTLDASGNTDSKAAADVTDPTIPDSEPNLTQKEEVSASATSRPEPQDQAASRNSSGENDVDGAFVNNSAGENDVETDGCSVHDVLRDDVTAVRDDVTLVNPTVNRSNTRPDERCHSAPEPTRNSEERTPERNSSSENVVPSRNEGTSAASNTQVRSTSASSELTSRQNRRVLRAQRRNRRQARNRSPSNRPPDGAEAESNGTHSRRCHSTDHDVVERFGLIIPEDEDENLDPEEIRKENQRLKNARLCQVCKDKDANRLFLPCAHLSSCSLCSPALTKCPQCKANIRGIVSVYFG